MVREASLAMSRSTLGLRARQPWVWFDNWADKGALSSNKDSRDEGETSPVVNEIPVVLDDSSYDQGEESGKFQQQRYIVETITMTTVTERRIVREADDLAHKNALASLKSKELYAESDHTKLNGILKGGRLWKCSENSETNGLNKKPSAFIEETATSFSLSSPRESEEGENVSGKRSVRFSEESRGQETVNQNGIRDMEPASDQIICTQETVATDDGSTSPESTELLLTFKLGNNVLVSNSLRPNSAVRQLFPGPPKFISPPPLTYQPGSEGSDAELNAKSQSDNMKNDISHHVTVTAETLRQLDEAKRLKQSSLKDKGTATSESQSLITVMPSVSLITGKSEEDSPTIQIRRTIERNTLRRSLLRHNNDSIRSRKNSASGKNPPENSLVERIRKLTCDLDEEENGNADTNNRENRKSTSDVATETLPCDAQGDVGFDTMPPRGSPLGEEATEYKDQKNVKFLISPNSDAGYRFIEKTSSPSASTSSSNSSGSASSTYKKITDLFARRNNENKNQIANVDPNYNFENRNQNGQIISSECHICNYGSSEYGHYIPPDLGNKSSGMTAQECHGETLHHDLVITDEKMSGGQFITPKCAVSKVNSTAEAKKQFLSTLAPFAACVTAGSNGDYEDEQYHQALIAAAPKTPIGERASVSSSMAPDDSEYSLDDIDEVLQDERKNNAQPDIVAGTQQQIENVDNENIEQQVQEGNVDELALFVEQDAGRIDRIKKRYSLNNSMTQTQTDDDEHDDYGFNRRPSVRGIKPRFGSTTEILQQLQSQGQPPAIACATRAGSHMTWPYGTPEGMEQMLADHPRRRGMLQMKNTAAMPVLQEEYPYKSTDSGTNSPTESNRKEIARRYISPKQIMYASTGNLYTGPQQIMRIGGGCNDVHMYGTLSNRGVHHVQHLQYPPASNSPPPGVPRVYPQTYTAVPAVAHGSQEQLVAMADTSVTGFQQHYPDDSRFASVQSLDRTSGSMFGRRPNQGLVQMRVSPVAAGSAAHYPPAASIRLAAPFNDPSITAIIEPHYSVQYPTGARPNSGASSIIRVGQGQQQTIRVPYPSGTPVQVHLLTRTPVGSTRSGSPQCGSPVGQQNCATVQQQYTVARSTQTPGGSSSVSSMYPVPPNARYYPQMSPLGNMNGPVYNHAPPQVNCVKSGVGRTSPSPYQNVTSSSSPAVFCSPTKSKHSNERGVPEGAASSSPNFPQDTVYSNSVTTFTNTITSPSVTESPITTPTTSTSTSNSVYYAMNV